MGLLKDQHNGLQQALALRVKVLSLATGCCHPPLCNHMANEYSTSDGFLEQELEGIVKRLRDQYVKLDQRRGLEIEGFNSEVALLVKQACAMKLLLILGTCNFDSN